MAVHRKATPLMEPMEAMARLAAGAQSRAEAAQTRSSGSASFDNADGTRTIIGPQTGSATIATHVGDVTPPGRPLGVAGASSAGVVYVAWGGELEGGIPADFDHVSVYMSVEGVSELVGTLTEAGIVSTVPMATTATVEVWATAEDDCCLADGTPAHNVSKESDHATVAVTQGEDAAAVDALRDRVSAVEAKADAATTAATAAQTKADEAATAAATAQSKADTASTAAATAQSKAEDATASANAAGVAAASAQAAAEAAQGDIDAERTYFWHDSEGAHVLGEKDGYRSDVRADGLHVLSAKDSTELANFTASGAQIGKTSGTHVTLDSDSLDIMDGTTTSASFGASTIDLGIESATISMAGKKLSIDVHTVTGGSSNSHRYDYIRLIIPTTSSASSNYNSSLQICSRDMTSGDMSYGMRIDCGYGEQGGTTVTLDGSLIANKTIYANAASLKQPLSVTDGGTGANTADGARANLGAAAMNGPGLTNAWVGIWNGNTSDPGYRLETCWFVNGVQRGLCVDTYNRLRFYGANVNNWSLGNLSGDKDMIPVYRLYNQNTGEHLFVSSASEYNSLVSQGWAGEGIVFYAFR